MQKNKMIAPSTEQAKNIKEILNLQKDVISCADFLHVDIMDGNFVERVLLSMDDLKILAKNRKLLLDFHLMCDFSENENLIDQYILLKPEIISVHFEAFKTKQSLTNTLKKIKQAGIKAGVAIKLETDIKEVFSLLQFVDIAVVMSVNVGWGGQGFNQTALEKIDALKKEIEKNKLKTLIEVDGGINDKKAKTIFDAGADILVCGSFVFNSENRCETIKLLRK